MRKKFDYWGIIYSELFPKYDAPYTVECDCGAQAKCIKSYKLYRCEKCHREYTLSHGDYVLLQRKEGAY
ncbi:DNA helicase UvrA [Enterococcus faecium]|uniref:DNA helicase UvrA n=1 Tax=Enterococcus faecium TaxID=1352 RepID=UPI000BF181C9|nr:DNA helicase UvrA [Enterococcus faecium]PEH49499.1 DNA helicase UvrA [Enterococcus faecium]